VKDGRIAAIDDVGNDAFEIIDAGGLAPTPGTLAPATDTSVTVCGRSGLKADGWRPGTSARLEG
jgi:hypothetical protein